MFKTLRAVGKRGKDKEKKASSPSSSSSSSSKKGSKASSDKIIGGPVLVNDSSDKQLTLSAPTRPMTKVDIHQLVRTSNLLEMKKHRFTDEEVNLRNEDGHTPLHAACSLERGNIEVVAYLISLGADVNAIDKAGWTPLLTACRFDDSGNVIPLLVSHGADVNQCNTDGTTPMHYFARKRLMPDALEANARALDVMLTAGADLNARNVNDETPLHSCVMKGSLATLELLINRSADVNAVNKVGDNVLHNAVLCQKLDMISKLLRMGMDPTASVAGSLNGSPLDLAKKDTSAAGKKIYELLTRPAIEDEEDESAETDKRIDLWSLTKAGDWNEIKKLYGSEEKQKLVLRVAEEELRAKNSAGRCLLHLACNQAEPNKELVDYLVTNSPLDISCVDNNGCTPLHYACKKNNDAETIVTLVVKGADVSRASNDGMKPIHYFARRSLQPEAVVSNEKGLDYMMKFGADINAQNKYGETPLHNAIVQGNFIMLQLLLSKNPDLTLKNQYDENILHYAIISQKKDMVDKILELGIDPRVGMGTNGTPLESAKLLSGGLGKEVYDIVQRKATALDIAGMNDEEKREYKRKRVIDELVETEREYANDLGSILKVYVNPLKALINTDEALLTEWQMEDIFGNIADIKVGSDKLSRALQICQAADPQYFGQVILSSMDDLHKYEEVCVHQQIATDALQEALHQKGFKSFCEAAQKHKDCKKLSIDALLIKPFQRITKYPLLLRELMGVTPDDHPDYPDIAKARDKLEVLINVANEKKRVIDNKLLIKQVSENLIYRDDEERLDLTVDEDRVFKREGLFKMSFNKERMIKRTAFLFSDLILLCQAEKKKYNFYHYIPISQCRVQDVADGSLEGGKAVKNAMSLTYQVKQLRVVICTDSAESKREWMNAIAECAAADPLTPKLKNFLEGSTGSLVGGASSTVRASQTLPGGFKGFGLRKHNLTSGDDHSSGDESVGSPRHEGGSMNKSAPPSNHSSDKKKGRLGSTLISSPQSSPTSPLSQSMPHGNPPSPSVPAASAPLERRNSKMNDDNGGSGGGILGVLRRKASTGERFKGGMAVHTDVTVSSPSDGSPTRTHASTVSGATLRGGTASHYEPARPRAPSSSSPSAAAPHSVGFSGGGTSNSSSFPAISGARFSMSPDSSPTSSPPASSLSLSTASSPSGGPKRRVRALSSYNTAPNRPLPSLPPGGGPQTFAAAAAAAHAASPSPATQKAAAATAGNVGAGGPATLTTTPSAARSLSVSSLGASFNIQLPLSSQHPLAKVLFDFVGDKEAFQIDLNEGDVVTVFEKDDEKGDGWWYGECNKATGYFPSHYVELL